MMPVLTQTLQQPFAEVSIFMLSGDPGALGDTYILKFKKKKGTNKRSYKKLYPLKETFAHSILVSLVTGIH